MFTVSIKSKQKNPHAYEQLKKRLEKISEKKVVAGFPKGKLNNPHYEPEDGKGPGPSIIDVAIWNNFGIGVPRRDFMTPASKEWKEYFDKMVELAKEALIDGTQDIDEFLNLMGSQGAEFISDAIIKLKTPPNAYVTIHGGWIKTKSGKWKKIKGKNGKNNPLVDSGDLSKAPTYELRRKEK